MPSRLPSAADGGGDGDAAADTRRSGDDRGDDDGRAGTSAPVAGCVGTTTATAVADHVRTAAATCAAGTCSGAEGAVGAAVADCPPFALDLDLGFFRLPTHVCLNSPRFAFFFLLCLAHFFLSVHGHSEDNDGSGVGVSAVEWSTDCDGGRSARLDDVSVVVSGRDGGVDESLSLSSGDAAAAAAACDDARVSCSSTGVTNGISDG